MKKPVLVLLCAALMLSLLSVLPPAGARVAAAFEDIQDHWARNEIQKLQQDALLGGYEDGTFRPERAITRGEFVTLIARAINLPLSNTYTDFAFTDVQALHWASQAIAASKELGLLTGYPDGTFRPNSEITRAETAAVLTKAYRYLNEDTGGAAFTDIKSSHWAYPYTALIAANGIASGNARNEFQPDRAVTRAEVAVFLSRTRDRNFIPVTHKEGEVTKESKTHSPSVQANPPQGTGMPSPPISPPNPPADSKEPLPDATAPNVYSLDLAAWDIYNDGTHALETTRGFNEALIWAQEQGYSIFKVPAGTYLIHKPVKNEQRATDGYIRMVGQMTFWADDNAVFQKETNDSEGYSTLVVPYGADNVIIRGGTYRGDKDTHDYSVKDTYGPGTHESGFGIVTAGSKNVTIDSVKAVNYTGDGLMVGGNSTLIQDLYAASFVSGNLGVQGEEVTDGTAIRSSRITLNSANKPMFATERHFELSNPHSLPHTFDIYYYTQNDRFIKRTTAVKMRETQSIPEGAEYMRIVFRQAGSANAYVEVWNRVLSDNVVVMNSEFAFNRRQGITVGGGNNIRIENNEIHDIGGIAPMSGIDVEGGYGENGLLNSNVFIKNNNFYNNQRYDVILYDGRDAVVEGNLLGSRGAIGLAVSQPFMGATIKNNHFEQSRIIVSHDVTFLGNTMNKSLANFEGPNVLLDGFVFTDSDVSVSSAVPFGVELRNVTMKHTKTADSGLGIWREPVRVTDLTIEGESRIDVLRGNGRQGNIFEGLKLVNTNGGNLVRGTYNNCHIESDTRGGVAINLDGSFELNGCTFTGKGTLLAVHHSEANVSINNSTFENLGDLHTIDVPQAKKFELRNSTITANHMVRTDLQMVKINDYWQQNAPYGVHEVIIEGNTLTSNLAVKGIQTIYAGLGAPPYIIRNNTLYNAVLFLKDNDINETNVNNVELVTP